MMNPQEKQLLARIVENMALSYIGQDGVRNVLIAARQTDKDFNPLAAITLSCAKAWVKRKLSELNNKEVRVSNEDVHALTHEKVQSLGHDMVYELAKRIMPNRLVILENGGNAFTVEDAAELKEKARKGTHIFYTSTAFNEEFTTWMQHVEQKYFPVEEPTTNDALIIALNYLPPGDGSYENPSDGFPIFTIGAPFGFKETAEKSLAELGLRPCEDGLSMMLFDGNGVTSSALSGKNIFQVSFNKK